MNTRAISRCLLLAGAVALPAVAQEKPASTRTARTATPAAPVASSVPPSAAVPAAPAATAAAAGSGCDESYLDAAAAPNVTISTQDLEAMCDPQNEDSLILQIRHACPKLPIDDFVKAHSKVCRSLTQVGANRDLDLMARVYYAVTPKLARPMASAERAPNQAQGIGAPAVAEGIGNFLTSRAEQELSAYAAVELFARICDSENKTLMPKSCALLSGQNDGADPVGLGLLQRAVTSDLQRLPESTLRLAWGNAKTGDVKDALCVVDAAYAITREVLEDPSQDPATVLTKAREQYGAFQPPDCNAVVWDKLTLSIKITADLVTLKRDLDVLRTVTDVATKRLYRSRVVADVTTLVTDFGVSTVLDEELKRGKVVISASEMLKELGAIATAVWNEDWVQAVSSVASADTLGHLVLCNNTSAQPCPAFDKTHTVLGIVGDIAAAKDSEGVQAVLNRVAQPVGTWRRKFRGKTTLSLNGYAGAKYAYESVQGGLDSGSALAPVLSLGLEWSLPCAAGHVRLYGQVVDVGNVASVHFAKNNSSNLTQVEADPNVGFPELLAPGGYITFAPFEAPLVIGAGGDWVPHLRKATDGSKQSVWQLALMVSVDVPILELYHL